MQIAGFFSIIWFDSVNLSCPQTQQQKFVNWQGDAEFKGEDFTATVTLGNPDVLVGSGRSSVWRCEDESLGKKWLLTVHLIWACLCCGLPGRYCCNSLPPVHHALSGSGRGAGLPPQARRGGHGDVTRWQIHRWDPGCGETGVQIHSDGDLLNTSLLALPLHRH